MIEHVPEAVHRHIHERTVLASRNVERSVVPILGFSARKRPEGIGTGVLLRVPPYFFLVTAAHVVTDGPPQLYVGLGGKALEIVEWFELLEESTDKTWSPDIAFAGLSALTVRELGGDRFLPLSSLAPGTDGARGSDALVLGYPASKAKANPKDACISPELMRYSSTVVPDENLASVGKNVSRQFAISFERDLSVHDAQLTRAPVPTGLSGSPVFGFNSLKSEGHSDPLVGIVTTWRREPPLSLIATDITVVVTAIFRAYPECLPLILPSDDR